MKFLRQSTAGQSRTIGPFIDSTDFITPLTGLTIANTDIRLMANGGAAANKNSGGGTHLDDGHYAITLDATDTATVGELTVSVVVAGALPFAEKFFVVEEAVYDLLYASGANPVTLIQDGLATEAALADVEATADQILTEVQSGGGGGGSTECPCPCPGDQMLHPHLQ